MDVYKSLCKKKDNNKCFRLVDLGCGYGVISKLFADLLCFIEIYGVDIDERVLNEATKLGIKTIKADLNNKLPLPDKYFQLAISFGVLDHLIWWDNFFIESNRILENQGLLVIYMTNLGGWDSRMSLLFGYQPRHVEISKKMLVGVHKRYLEYSSKPAGHIRTCTLRAIVNLAEYYGFVCTKKFGLKIPIKNVIIGAIDKIVSCIPTLSSRYLIILKKVKEYEED